MAVTEKIRWPDYKEPASEIARVVQMPLYRITPEAVVSAYLKDERKKRKWTDQHTTALEPLS